MSFALLWIETLITTLLWVAMVDCWAVRRKRWTALAARIIARILPALPLSIFVTAGGIMKRAEIEPNWFEYSLALLLAYLIGAIWIWRSGRRIVDGIISVKLWPAKRLATYLLVSAVLTNMTLWNMDLAVQSRAAVLKVEAGSLVLAACPPVESDSQNAALFYEKAFAQLDADPVSRTADLDELDINSPAMIDALKRHADTVALLRKGSKLPACQFERDFADQNISILLPEIWHSIDSANLLLLQTRQELREGQIEQAVWDIGTILRFSRHIGQGPALVYSAVSTGIDRRAIQALQETFPHISRSDQLAPIDLSDADSQRRILHRGLLGEEGFGLSTIAEIAEGRLSPSVLLGNNGGMQLAGAWPISAIMRVFFLSDDVNQYAKLMEAYQKGVESPFYMPNSDELAKAKSAKLGLFTRPLFPSLERAFEIAAQTTARDTAGNAAMAIVKYRIVHGALPDKWDDLVPAYLDAIPLDPFNGKPLQINKKSDQWVIYSVGPHGKTDADGPTTEDDTRLALYPGFVLKLTHPTAATAPAP